MSRTDEQILSTTESVCPDCLRRIPAQRVARGSDVILRKTCPDHGLSETVIWRGTPAFSAWRRPKTPSYPTHPATSAAEGCPYDCGLCPDHHQHTCTALLEVTQRCNLRCPVCFASAGGAHPPDPGLDLIRGWYQSVLDSGGPANIQLSGGEPTVRHDLPDIVRMGREMGFGFIQVNTNGLRFASDPAYVAALKEAGLSSVFLQFDGTEDAIYRHIRGLDLFEKKVAAIERLAEHEIGVILVPTLVPGINTHNIGAIIRFAMSHIPAVRGVHFQPVSYFGRYPTAPADADRITIPEVIRAIEEQTGGAVLARHFEPPGCENAMCSFHGNFIGMPDGTLSSWSHHDEAEACGCQPVIAAEGAQKARGFVAQNWVMPADIVSVGEIGTMPSGLGLGGWDVLLARARTHKFSISGMAFQDAWTLDLERLHDCCIHVVSPSGRLIPFCAYNLTDRQGRTLYRGYDEGIGYAAYTTGTVDRR